MMGKNLRQWAKWKTMYHILNYTTRLKAHNHVMIIWCLWVCIDLVQKHTLTSSRKQGKTHLWTAFPRRQENSNSKRWLDNTSMSSCIRPNKPAAVESTAYAPEGSHVEKKLFWSLSWTFYVNLLSDKNNSSKARSKCLH